MSLAHKSERTGNAIRRRVLIFAALCLFATGGRARAETPSISKSTITAAPGADLKPAVEVSSESWPVRLTMRLLEMKIHPYDHLWYQLTVTNFGDVPILIDPFVLAPTEVRWNAEGKKFIFFEVAGPKGLLIRCSSLGTETMIDDPPDPGTPAELLPGESRTTLPWAFNPYDYGHKPELPGPSPRGQFSELPNYLFSEPGEYRIRAVYDYVFPDNGKPEAQLRREGGIRVETPWVSFSVIR